MSAQAAVLDLPLEVLTDVCQQLDLHDLVRVAETCKRFRHGDGGLETAELPTKSPVVTALRDLAFPGDEQIPSTRPTGCSESWVAYLARRVRQRRCLEAPPIRAGYQRSLFIDTAGRLLACGTGAAVGHGEGDAIYPDPIPVATIAAIRMRSVALGSHHILALGWDGRVYSWGRNAHGELGHGDQPTRPAPALVEGREGVRCIASADDRSFAVTQSGEVLSWGCGRWFQPGRDDSLRPITVEGLGFRERVRVRRVCAKYGAAFAIGADGEVFSWGCGQFGRIGHGDAQDQPSPKRVEALRGVRVSSAAIGMYHALVLAADGQVYACGKIQDRALVGNAQARRVPLPKPVKALRGVRVVSVAADRCCNYALADTGELWAWGSDGRGYCPLGHGENKICPLPKPIGSLRGIRLDAVAAGNYQALARADDGSVYAWGNYMTAGVGAPGLGPSVSDAGVPVPIPQRIPALRVACGF